jgi:hypothetical protein
MSSVHTIKQIKHLTNVISTNAASPEIKGLVAEIAEYVHNPYLLCLPALFTVAETHSVDVSSITSKVQGLKDEYKKR